MITLTRDELLERLKEKQAGQLFDMRDIELSDADLSGADLSEVDFSLSSFHRVRFDRADMHGCAVENALFDDCSFRGTDFRRANLKGAAMRYDDLSGADISGANLFSAVLEHANLSGIISDADTKFFRLYCPEKGAFLGYKKCFNNRLVQLLIPADAKRTSATMNSCRCSRAKVLSIKSFDYAEEFDEACVPGGRQLCLPQGAVGGGAGLQRGPVDGLHHRHPLLADKRRGEGILTCLRLFYCPLIPVLLPQDPGRRRGQKLPGRLRPEAQFQKVPGPPRTPARAGPGRGRPRPRRRQARPG